MEWVKAYKGFNLDMTCRGFQFEQGGEYHEDHASLCDSGFHAFENPMDVFNYYAPGTSVYHKVWIGGDPVQRSSGNDTKICGTDIRIGDRLDVAWLVRAHFEYTKARCTNEYNAEPGNPATAGAWGAATAGDSGAATAGAWGAATAGDSGAATAGDSGSATAGAWGAATSRGTVTVGENGSGLVRGNGVRIRGGMGAIIAIVEENESNYDIKFWCVGVIDGETLKPNVWYKCENGNFVEAEDQ